MSRAAFEPLFSPRGGGVMRCSGLVEPWERGAVSMWEEGIGVRPP